MPSLELSYPLVSRKELESNKHIPEVLSCVVRSESQREMVLSRKMAALMQLAKPTY
jgi:hypothetical protein